MTVSSIMPESDVARVLAAEGVDFSTQQLLLLAAVVLAGFFFMRMIRKVRPLDEPPRPIRRESDPVAHQYEATRRDVEQLLLELDNLAREIGAQADTRSAKLQQMIVDADRRISALRILLDAAQAAGASLGDVTRFGAASSGFAAHDSTRTEDAAVNTEASPDQPVEVRSRRIYELADGGLPLHQIAQRLGEPIGEVELILNLREAAGGGPWPGAQRGR